MDSNLWILFAVFVLMNVGTTAIVLKTTSSIQKLTKILETTFKIN